MFELRDFQKDLVQRAQASMQAGGTPCVVAPTGAGKTVILAEMARLELQAGRRVVVIAHRGEIVQQLRNSLRKHLGDKLPFAMITAGSNAPMDRPVTIGMVPTMARRLHKLAPLKGCTLLADEAHHSGAKSWMSTVDALEPRRRAGLTATPIRPDGRGLGGQGGFTELVIGPQARELMDAGFLCEYTYLVASKRVSGQGLRKASTGDYRTKDLEELGNTILGEIVPTWQKHNPQGLSTISVACSVDHAYELEGLYRSAGIKAKAVLGTTPKAERAKAFDDFRSGKLTVLVACAVIDEGLDVPEATVLQITRPTASLRLYRQLAGRVLRPAPGKDRAIFIDHTDNFDRLPLPDADIEWELDSPAKEAAPRSIVIDDDEVKPEAEPKGPPVEVPDEMVTLKRMHPVEMKRTLQRLANEAFADGNNEQLAKLLPVAFLVLPHEQMLGLEKRLLLPAGWAAAQAMLGLAKRWPQKKQQEEMTKAMRAMTELSGATLSGQSMVTHDSSPHLQHFPPDRAAAA